MNSIGLLLLSFLSSSYAAPAIVWNNQNSVQGSPFHTSDDVKAFDLMGDLLQGTGKDSSLASVMFLLDRDANGMESLSNFASSGKLPLTEVKYGDADYIHHHVSGVESTQSMVRDCKKANPEQKVLSVTLDELSNKLMQEQPVVEEIEIERQGMVQSKKVKAAKKRARDLDSADVLIVKVDPTSDCHKKVDEAIASAVDNETIGNVVLAGVRSTREVVHERRMLSQNKGAKMATVDRRRRKLSVNNRRLEDEEGDDDNANNNDDFSGVYYVHMTPNILAGVLFTFMFATVAWIGITCMGQISGQDVYVKKLPAIGREA